MNQSIFTFNIKKGLELLNQGNFNDAEKVFNEILKSYPKNWDARIQFLLLRNLIW